jgi:CDP-2,3-bis-(O-geranylgeranyl)-sn-glycerol synthase
MPLEILLVIVLLACNAVPVLVRAALGPRMRWPLDAGIVLADGRPLLGRSKTVVGLVSAVATAALAAAALGLGTAAGTLIGVCAMTGDALSSFIKRRMGLVPGARATGLDQVPEALLPAIASQALLPLDWTGVLIVTLLFAAANPLLSRLLDTIGVHLHPH